jgi:hypothetical protein
MLRRALIATGGAAAIAGALLVGPYAAESGFLEWTSSTANP